MIAKNALYGILGLPFVVGCSGQDGGSKSPEAISEQASALGNPVLGPTGEYSRCTSAYECTASSGYPSLIINCPETVTFLDPGSGAPEVGTQFQILATDIMPTYPVYVEVRIRPLFQAPGRSSPDGGRPRRASGDVLAPERELG